MIAFFCRIWARRYSRLLRRGSTSVQSAPASSNSSSDEDDADGEREHMALASCRPPSHARLGGEREEGSRSGCASVLMARRGERHSLGRIPGLPALDDALMPASLAALARVLFGRKLAPHLSHRHSASSASGRHQPWAVPSPQRVWPRAPGGRTYLELLAMLARPGPAMPSANIPTPSAARADGRAIASIECASDAHAARRTGRRRPDVDIASRGARHGAAKHRKAMRNQPDGGGGKASQHGGRTSQGSNRAGGSERENGGGTAR